MNLERIKQKAAEEVINIEYYINLIRSKIEASPEGTSLNLPRYLIPKIEAHCDQHNIPFYHVAETLCSFAKTYSALYAMEQQR